MVTEAEGTHFADADTCLITNKAILSLSNPDAAGVLDRRSNISGWYSYWFSLSGSQLLYFERTPSGRRGLLVGTISLFRHKLTIINSIKRRREFEIQDASGKLHLLRAASDAELHWWVQTFDHARKKIPPAQPINPTASPRGVADTRKGIPNEQYSAIVDTHLEVDHVLCVVHGIGVSSDILSANTSQLQESYTEIMARVFPDIDFRVELLVIHWRDALMNLDVHRKLQAVIPIAPEPEDANPLRQFMVHRIVDYVYYTHERYRRHIMREVASQLNAQIDSLRQRRPDFNGKISIMGHSLGAALCYDLMCRKVHDDQVLLASEGMRLNFDADNLFCLGNPLGTFLGLDPTIGLGSNMLTLPFKIFNMFKYHDPIATRLEPQLDLSMVDVCPVTVPCWFNMGLRESTAQWLGTWWPGGEKRKGGETPTSSGSDERGKSDMGKDEETGKITGVKRVESSCSESGSGLMRTGGAGCMEALSDAEQSPTTVSGKDEDGDIGWRSNGRNEESETKDRSEGRKGWEKWGQRLDYALQASSTMEDVSTSWSALKAHTEYWSNRDAMLFMVSCMMKSSFCVGEGWEADDVDKRIVDADILRKQEDGRGGGFAGKQDEWEMGEEESLEAVVRQVVEKVVDEAVATHELMKIHPQVRIRSGGLTSKSPAGSETEMVKEASGNNGGSGGWAAYLRKGWFGGETNKRNSKSAQGPS